MIDLDISVSNHAKVRCVQRSVPEAVVAWIMDFGTAQRRNHADVYALDQKGRRELKRSIGDALYRYIAPALDTYVVVGDDGVVITAARRLKRIRR